MIGMAASLAAAIRGQDVIRDAQTLKGIGIVATGRRRSNLSIFTEVFVVPCRS
jgi:hypothetical protein